MPKFPKNTNSFMKYQAKGSSFPFKSPLPSTWQAVKAGAKGFSEGTRHTLTRGVKNAISEYKRVKAEDKKKK